MGNHVQETGLAPESLGIFTAIDPQARFQESFERLFGPEIQRNRSVDELSASVGLFLSSITGIDRAITGGP